ncbi:MAG: hypothetical protein A2X12_10760 [Bacteroidetes bacterium GWE2_29_8]|nr:MAG: hypothetical protein A2X12_10760 [Bacteroidetes bacterium GWE2_29_8]OFY24827.1 MAG: hypothetical protein A2X02_03765 [Bacteroidetes bacterium GWF2_29_10]
METETKHINLSYLSQISGGSKDFELEMMQMFIDQIPDAITNLGIAVDSKDWDRVRAISHKAKSSVGIFGMNEIKDNLFFIEKNAKELSNLDEIKTVFDKTKKLIDEAMEELKNQINS